MAVERLSVDDDDMDVWGKKEGCGILSGQAVWQEDSLTVVAITRHLDQDTWPGYMPTTHEEPILADEGCPNGDVPKPLGWDSDLVQEHEVLLRLRLRYL